MSLGRNGGEWTHQDDNALASADLLINYHDLAVVGWKVEQDGFPFLRSSGYWILDLP